MTQHEYASLIRDAIVYLKECSNTTFATKEEWELLTCMPSSKPQAEQQASIKSLVQRLAPSLPLSDLVPSDAMAKQSWHIESAVLVLACDSDAETLEMIKNLSKAIDQKLGRTKALSAQRLEKDNGWEQLLAQSCFQLIIASCGFRNLQQAMRYCSQRDSGYRFGQYPLLILNPVAAYSPKEKIALWNQIQAIVQKR